MVINVLNNWFKEIGRLLVIMSDCLDIKQTREELERALNILYAENQIIKVENGKLHAIIKKYYAYHYTQWQREREMKDELFEYLIIT